MSAEQEKHQVLPTQDVTIDANGAEKPPIEVINDGFEEESSSDDSDFRSISIVTKLKSRFPQWRLAFHVFWGCFFTSWWMSIIIQKKHRSKWLIPTIFWMMMMVRLITFHSRILYVLFGYVTTAWNYCVDILYTKLIPNRTHRILAAAALTVAVILVGTFVPSETEYSKREDRAVSFFGLVVCIAGLYATSKNRSKIQWRTVIGGTLMQFIIALFVLRTKCGYDVFNFISTLARELLGFAKDGVAFLTSTEVSQYGMFFFTVLPAVAFFVAFIHILYYFNIMQWCIRKVANLFFWALKVTGAEAVTASGSPFLGIGESSVLVKDFMPFLTKAEIHQVMTSGFSTISGSVLVGYIGLGLNPQVMVSSCVMSIPASLAISKMRYPETEIPVTSARVDVCENFDEKEGKPKNVLQAFSNGATLGLRIAGLMMIQCMCIIALVALINGILTWFGNFWNIPSLTLELMGSYLLYPVTFLLGTPRSEILPVSKLIAIKVIQNEYNAYSIMLSDEPYKSMSKRAIIIATYALCGFSNLGSMGIQIGVLGALAPKKVKDIAQVIISALISGLLATLTSTAIAGMVMHDLTGFDV
ncbi:hypothetical protein CLIB1423_18S01574 [[Candida] railenensis]|uniref:Uncharacterized protein n=1 Tax=[Candida] railenensis TaxID=45579 RepID=A0A9P0W0L5_9ASCO|nr:hypothetical protein CLIB1423_18S01574 [[Candida] railenensis]